MPALMPASEVYLGILRAMIGEMTMASKRSPEQRLMRIDRKNELMVSGQTGRSAPMQDNVSRHKTAGRIGPKPVLGFSGATATAEPPPVSLERLML